MKTLILTLILLLPLSSIADVPCHVAIEQQHDSILKLEQQLKTAQSVPYNQGYQEGYKVAKLEQWKPEEVIELIVIIGFFTIALIVAYGMFIAPTL